MSDAGSRSSGRRRRFVLQRRIGAGAFGEVYLAEQDSGAGFTRPVALKLLNPDVAGSREAGRRMRDEARILGRLSHRNIVSVLDLVHFGDRWGVVMDYVPGADLEEILVGLDDVEGDFPPPAAFEVGAAVCRALHAAWTSSDGRGGQLRVVHRDIKPSNVRITSDGDVKVLDFGVARVDLDTRESATKAQGWIGTERFMAPERILMEGDTPAGDVYALGASVVELILREPLGRTPVLPDRHQPFVDEALDKTRRFLHGEGADDAIELLRRCLTSVPSDRPSAVEASRAMAEIARRLEGESLTEFSGRFVSKVAERNEAASEPVSGVLSEDATPTASVLQTSSEAPADATYFPPADAEEPQRRSVLPLVLGVGAFAALLVLLLGGGALYWLSQPGEAPAPQPQPSELTAPAPVVTPAPIAAPERQDAAPPEPDTEADTEPDTEPPAPEPVAPAPVPVAPTPVVSRPAPVVRPEPAPEPEPVAVDPNAPRVSRALVVMQDASSIEVTCGDRSGRGTSSVRIVDFPAGSCRVRANYLGSPLETTVSVARATTVQCTANGGTLSCTGS